MKTKMKVAGGFSFVAAVVLLAQSGSIPLDIGALGIGAKVILAIGLMAGIAIVSRFIDKNYDEGGRDISEK